jgi:hypothetical protein
MPYRKALRFKANSFFVRRKTGCGIAPEGWLWTMMKAHALKAITGFKTSLG